MRPDPRPPWLRVLVLIGLACLALPALAGTVIGLVTIRTASGQSALCMGLAALVCLGAGIGKEVVELRARTNGPQPRLGEIDGEPALVLSRAAGPTAVSTAALVGLAGVTALGAVFAALSAVWAGAVFLAAIAALLWWSSGGQGGVRPGALTLTRTRIVDEHRGNRVEVAWSDVTGVFPDRPMQVSLRPGSEPAFRGSRRGRAWKQAREGVVNIDADHVAGGPTYAWQTCHRALGDHAYRAALGTPASLPPTPHQQVG